MMTQTHVLVGVALFARPGKPARNLMAIAGGIVPDAAIFILYAIEKLRGTPESVIWSDVYFSPFWQDAVAWGNSVPLWLLLLVIGLVLVKSQLNGAVVPQDGMTMKVDNGNGRTLALASLLVVFAGSCLAHMACDFPLHVDDAHRHFFPLSSWRFRSAVSYWDPNHYGVQAASCEAIFGIGLSIWMWMRFKNIWARTGIVIMSVGYLAVPAWFAIQFF